jgi:hypothetical protein
MQDCEQSEEKPESRGGKYIKQQRNQDVRGKTLSLVLERKSGLK